jgi:hypothetical protein
LEAGDIDNTGRTEERAEEKEHRSCEKKNKVTDMKHKAIVVLQADVLSCVKCENEVAGAGAEGKRIIA